MIDELGCKTLLTPKMIQHYAYGNCKHMIGVLMSTNDGLGLDPDQT